jgi:transglutaminase/protease-like cytokinesis protein 3
MKNNFFICLLIIVTVCATFFSSCKERVTDVTLNKTTLELAPGDCETLVATIYPNDATNTKVTWTSNNPEIATVTDNGLITAISDGSTNITVSTKDGKKTATCEIIVDYRTRWIGDWNFEVKRSYKPPLESSIRDTIYYFGKIYIANVDNEININYRENVILTVMVDELGNISKKHEDPHHYFTSGYFEGKNIIHIEDNYSGLASYHYRTIDGIKGERRRK